ncbi:MAG: diaminopimelate epimerase [Lachnospiraceae bacterium]|nr:diaminopimelate epimerase [Lachnospiraceae bacterium]
MRFTKMHGLGNDYVYVNCFQETIEHPSEVAVRVSDRHFGIGSDGLILIKPSDRADFQMEMYNADGSLGAMCGNGIRCVAKYVYDYGLTDKTRISVETASGMKYLDLMIEQSRQDLDCANARGKVSQVRVDMGAPILEPARIPVDISVFHSLSAVSSKDDTRMVARPIISKEMLVDSETYAVTCVSMGNPHCIVPVEDVDALEIEKIGPLFETHPAFPDRVNTEFIKVIDRHTVQMRVWERGSGETLACGTGACAVAVACILNKWTDNEATVKLRGGDLRIAWDQEQDTVYMTGPAATVFEGEMIL